MKREFRIATTLCALLSISACGGPRVNQYGAVVAGRQVTTAPTNTMNIHLIAHEPKPVARTGNAASTTIRIYQLKSITHFETLNYPQLQQNDIVSLRPDLLATKHLVLRANTNVSISDTMHAETEFIGVVAFFQEGKNASQWKLVLPKNQWDNTDPIRIKVRENSLQLH